MNLSRCNSKSSQRRKKFEAQREGVAVRRRQSFDEAVSRRARFQADRRADQGVARNPRGHGRRASDAAVVARRCRFRQNRRGGVLRTDGAGKRIQRRADGTDGNSGGTAFSEFLKMVRAARREGGNANGKPENSRAIEDRRSKMPKHARPAILNSQSSHSSSAPTPCSRRASTCRSSAW